MVGEIRIYIEGGGDFKDTKADLRRGFSLFLSEIVQMARSKSIKWNIITCGSRNSTFTNWKFALKSHPDAFNILLVDSEGPVAGDPWHHLEIREKWANPGQGNEQCHLMVQAMEAWIIADQEALATYYGDGFNPNPLPKNPNVESISVPELVAALEVATQNTKKQKYHKTRHAPDILAKIDYKIVCEKAPHCRRLFQTIEEIIGNQSP